MSHHRYIDVPNPTKENSQTNHNVSRHCISKRHICISSSPCGFSCCYVSCITIATKFTQERKHFYVLSRRWRHIDWSCPHKKQKLSPVCLPKTWAVNFDCNQVSRCALNDIHMLFMNSRYR